MGEGARPTSALQHSSLVQLTRPAKTIHKPIRPVFKIDGKEFGSLPQKNSTPGDGTGNRCARCLLAYVGLAASLFLQSNEQHELVFLRSNLLLKLGLNNARVFEFAALSTCIPVLHGGRRRRRRRRDRPNLGVFRRQVRAFRLPDFVPWRKCFIATEGSLPVPATECIDDASPPRRRPWRDGSGGRRP